MNLRELFEKIYNGEIGEEDVIVEHDKMEREYDRYILNDKFDYWYYEGDGVISLRFFTKDEDEDREYSIISKEEFEEIIDKKEKQEKIKKLKRELAELEE